MKHGHGANHCDKNLCQEFFQHRRTIKKGCFAALFSFSNSFERATAEGVEGERAPPGSGHKYQNYDDQDK